MKCAQSVSNWKRSRSRFFATAKRGPIDGGEACSETGRTEEQDCQGTMARGTTHAGHLAASSVRAGRGVRAGDRGFSANFSKDLAHGHHDFV